MLQLMKELRFLILLLIAVLLVQNAGAASVLFDFDDVDLPWWGGALLTLTRKRRFA